ncbi:MAG: DUF2807 domain-containing protein [bacterium]|nr:DUF2807 domain-containing protein [bacterium]
MSRPLPITTLLVAGLALATTTACSRSAESSAVGSGGRAAQNWSALKDFRAIDATGPDDVVVTTGDQFAVRAEGDPKAIERLDIKVKGDTLMIGRTSDGLWGGGYDGKGAKILVTMPAITAAAITGAGDFDLDRADGKTLDLSLTGAGDFRVGMVKLARLSIAITGAGSIKIAGTADEGKLSVTGTGDIHGAGLKLGKADVSLLGVGDIDFASDGPVAISLMGPGDVTVKGKAQCTTKGVGPGEVHCAP